MKHTLQSAVSWTMKRFVSTKYNVGSRIRRGLFVTKNGLRLNADINGALNIMVLGCNKINVKRDALVIEPANMRFVVNPIRLTLSQ